MECKTGRGNLYQEVRKFIRRDAELDAEYSLFIYDRDYTFQRGAADIPALTAHNAKELGIREIHSISISSHKFFKIVADPVVGNTRYFLACGGFNRLEDRIRYMIRYAKEVMKPFGPAFAPEEAPKYSSIRMPFADTVQKD